MIRLFAAIVVAMSAPAWAAGSATVIAAGISGPIELYWADTQTMRLNMPGLPGYLLVREGQGYTVTRAGGQTLVMDMAVMLGMLAGPNGPPLPSVAANALAVSELTPTGRTEVIAGITGQVYEVTWTDGNGQDRTDDAVLTEAAVAVEMTQAFANFAEIAAAAGGYPAPDAIRQLLQDRQLGVLRFSNQFHVQAITAAAPPSTALDLPAQPVQLPGLPAQGGSGY